MRIICSYESLLLFIAIRDKIFGFEIENGTDPKEYQLSEGINSIINCLLVSDDGRFLYASYSNKWICCWDIASADIKGKQFYKKRPTSIVFGRFFINAPSRSFATGGDKWKDVLIIGDKSGEITGVDHFLSQEAVSCGAHTTSVITDMMMDKENKLVISCDRDGNIINTILNS